MRKTVRAALSSFLLLGILLTNIASAQEATITPRHTGISSVTSGLTISKSGCARCTGIVIVRDGYTASIKVELKQDGSTIKTWTDSGTDTVDAGGIYYVKSGHTYVVTTTVTVYDSDGKFVEKPSQDSPSKYY